MMKIYASLRINSISRLSINYDTIRKYVSKRYGNKLRCCVDILCKLLLFFLKKKLLQLGPFRLLQKQLQIMPRE